MSRLILPPLNAIWQPRVYHTGYPCGCHVPCPCSACIDNEGPDEVEVTIAGITEVSGDCDECDSFNTTFVVACDTPCVWLYVFPSPVCDVGQVRLNFSTDLAGNHLILVHLVSATLGISLVRWQHATGSSDPVDCQGWSGLSLSPLSSGIAGCSAFGSTCSITAV